MLTLATVAASTDHSGILCTLLLIVALIATVLVVLSLLGIGYGPFGRRTVGAGYGYLGGPVALAVICWVLYIVLC